MFAIVRGDLNDTFILEIIGMKGIDEIYVGQTIQIESANNGFCLRAIESWGI